MGKYTKFLAGIILIFSLTACNEQVITPANSAISVSAVTMPNKTVAVTASASALVVTPSTTASEPTLNSLPTSPAATATTTLKQNNEPIELKFGELLSPKTTPINLLFSDQALAAKGKRVSLTGYVSLSQKPDMDFTILTNNKSITCSCCYTAGDLPIDLVLLKLPDGMKPNNFGDLTTFTGQFEVGDEVDGTTGIVTLFRLKVESFSPVKAD